MTTTRPPTTYQGQDRVPLVISSPLEPELVDRIRGVDSRLEVLYAPELLATPRYVADHGGQFETLDAEQDRRWHEMLERAVISFDFDRREPEKANANFPNLEWIQATSAGVGQVVPRFDLDLDRVTVTTTAGVHAEPLSEFVVTSLFYFVKGVPDLLRRQRERDWTRYTSELLAGKRVMVVGLGAVGRRTAEKLTALDVDVVAAIRPGSRAKVDDLAGVVDIADIDTTVGQVDAVVLACPLTAETEGLISATTLAAMRPDCVLVNIARGQVVDEPAMTESLREGRLQGAAIDVAWVEPLPADSPLWGMDRVLISPHSASTVAQENELIVDLFCDNLKRWFDGAPLRNVYQPDRGY